MKPNYLKTMVALTIGAVLFLPLLTTAQEAVSPPSLGQETKGTPTDLTAQDSSSDDDSDQQESIKQTHQAYGNTDVTEYRRENGQVYRMELEHSENNKQYIEDTSSKGNLGSTDNGIEETPNLPKLKLGSW